MRPRRAGRRLAGQRVLVVEDDNYLANDAARALQLAGAEVVGPFPTQAAALDALSQNLPTSAVLDIRLYDARSFDLARALQRHSVPFVFLSGYDEEVIPQDLHDVARLSKPTPFNVIVKTLAGTTASPPVLSGPPVQKFFVSDRVTQGRGMHGTVVATERHQFKVRWDDGRTSYYRHRETLKISKLPVGH